MSTTIIINDSEFAKFVSNMNKHGFRKDPDDTSDFPLDFVVFYKETYVLNFERMHDHLEFFVIGRLENGKKRIYKTEEEMNFSENKRIESEVKQKIKQFFAKK